MAQYGALWEDLKHSHMEFGLKQLVMVFSDMHTRMLAVTVATWHRHLRQEYELAAEQNVVAWKDEQIMMDKLALAQRMAREAEREVALEKALKARVIPVLARATFRMWAQAALHVFLKLRAGWETFTKHRNNCALVIVQCLFEWRDASLLRCVSQWTENFELYMQRVRAVHAFGGTLLQWKQDALLKVLQRWRQRWNISHIMARYMGGFQIVKQCIDFAQWRSLVHIISNWRTQFHQCVFETLRGKRFASFKWFTLKCVKIAAAPKVDRRTSRVLRQWQENLTQHIVVSELTEILQNILVHRLDSSPQEAGSGLLDSTAARAIGIGIGIQSGAVDSAFQLSSVGQALKWRSHSKLLWLVLRWKQRIARATNTHRSEPDFSNALLHPLHPHSASPTRDVNWQNLNAELEAMCTGPLAAVGSSKTQGLEPLSSIVSSKVQQSPELPSQPGTSERPVKSKSRPSTPDKPSSQGRSWGRIRRKGVEMPDREAREDRNEQDSWTKRLPNMDELEKWASQPPQFM